MVMVRPLWGLLLWLLSAPPLWALDFNHYHTEQDISAYLHEVASDHRDFAHFHVLGYSQHGREIDYLVLAKGDPDALPAIYFNGTHHGDEQSSTEGILGLIDYLVSHRATADVSELLASYAIYIQPLVNPDGFALNTRFNAEGHDPNRDYAYPERGDSESFKTPAIRLVKELTDKVRFRAAAAYHAGMEAVLWPWCYSAQRNPENDTFYTIAKTVAQALRVPHYQQSYADYPTRGEFIDYMYMTQGTLALTFELSAEPTPPISKLAGIVKRSIAGAMAFMLDVWELDHGRLKIEHPADAPALRPLATVRANHGAVKAE